MLKQLKQTRLVILNIIKLMNILCRKEDVESLFNLKIRYYLDKLEKGVLFYLSLVD